MNVSDPVGWVASRLEWWVFWLAAADDRGLVPKERVRAMYDGSLWRALAEEATRRRGYDIFVEAPPPQHKAQAARAEEMAVPAGSRAQSSAVAVAGDGSGAKKTR